MFWARKKLDDAECYSQGEKVITLFIFMDISEI
jgi:hypothetical protein